MKSVYKLISILLLFTMLLAACGGAADTEQPADVVEEVSEESAAEAVTDPMDYLNAAREDTVIIDRPYRLEGGDNWNPWTPGNSCGFGMTNTGFESLFLLNYETGEMMPWLAESFESNDEMTDWTLKIKEDITFYDGTPMTIDDIIWSIETQIANEGLGSHFTWVEWVDSLEKVDEYTMIWHLTKPNPRWVLDYFANKICGGQMFMPKHVWETIEDPMTFTNLDIEQWWPMGTGPYMVAKITENEVFMVRNDNWWGSETGFMPLPQPELVIFSYVGAEEIRTAAAIEDEFDSMEDLTYGAFQAIQAQNPNWVAYYEDLPYTWPDPCARSIGINNAIEPWDDKEMRWVLNYVMDRQQIIDIAYEGTTVMGPYFWPAYPAMDPFTELIPEDKLAEMLVPNTDKAAAILTEKGYVKDGDYWTKDGEELIFELQVNEAFSELERLADVYIEQLQRFGINAVKIKLQAGTFYDNSSFGNYTAQSSWFTCGSINEPWGTLRTLTGEAAPIGERPVGGQNAYRWYNEEYTEIVNELGTLALDDPKVMELTERALEILYDEMPVLPSAQSRKLIPYNYTYWTNWPTADNDIYQPPSWCAGLVYILTQIEKVD